MSTRFGCPFPLSFLHRVKASPAKLLCATFCAAPDLLCGRGMQRRRRHSFRTCAASQRGSAHRVRAGNRGRLSRPSVPP
eukprot:159914-Chlamydomonas_euryale.AAC.1